MGCIIITSKIKELAKNLPEESDRSVANLVGLWQQQKNKSIEDIPSVEELKSFIKELRERKEKKLLLKKEIEEDTISTISSDEQREMNLDFTPEVRRDRVSLIARLYSLQLDSILKETLETLNNRYNSATDDREKTIIKSKIKNLNRRNISPLEVLKRVENVFRGYVQDTEENQIQAELNIINSKKGADKLSDENKLDIATKKAQYKREEYNKVLKHFGTLVNEANAILRVTEQIKITAQSIVTSESDISERDAEYNESTINDIEDAFSKDEDTVKDNWMFDFRTISVHETLSTSIRKLINKIPKRNSNGKIMVDDLGYPKYIDANIAVATILETLKPMTDPDEMLPLLEEGAKTKSWLKQIIKVISKDDMLFSRFYQNFRKDQSNYWIETKTQLPDGSIVTKLIKSREGDKVEVLISNWKSNIENGEILNADTSLYNNNGEVIKERIESNKKALNELIKSISSLSSSRQYSKLSEEETFNKVVALLNSIGINPNIDDLKDALTVDRSTAEYTIYSPITRILKSLSILYNDLDKNINKTQNKLTEKLLNDYNSVYSTVAQVLSKYMDNIIESSAIEGGKSYYTYHNPSYLETLIKRLKNSMQNITKYKEFLQREFKDYDWFYNQKTNTWRNGWLELIENDGTIRKELEHKVVLNFGKTEYANLTPLEYLTSLITEYLGVDNKWAWYPVPILADAPSGEFIKFVKYTKANGDNYQEILLDKFVKLVSQEYSRIMLVRARKKNGVSPISNFDITEKNKIGGNEFKFLPSLNKLTYEGGISFADKLGLMSQDKTVSSSDLENFIKETVLSVIESDFKEEYKKYKELGLLDKTESDKYIYLPYKTEIEAEEGLREYYWNSKYAASQIFQLTIVDLAFFKNSIDEQKRHKGVHTPILRLNTKAKYKGEQVGREYEKTIYLKDDVTTSKVFDDIKEIMEVKVAKGELSESDKNDILDKYKEVNVTDAQAFRSLKSFRRVQIMSGSEEWTDETEAAYQHLISGNWTKEDFDVLWQIKKPFYYGQNSVPSGIKGRTPIKVPTQNKNSEFILLAMYTEMSKMFGKSDKLVALSEFMDKHDIDLVQFQSSVKIGEQGVVDLNDVNTKEEVNKRLEEMAYPNGVESPEVVHSLNYENYGIVSATPEHFIDRENRIGTQLTRLITMDMSPDMEIIVDGKKMNPEEWNNLYNAVLVENIIESFNELKELLGSTEKVSELLIDEIRGNQRYSIDLLNAVTLKDGKFQIPIYDSVLSTQIQALLNSVIRNRVIKQKIKGGAAIQVTSYGLVDPPKIVFEGEGANKRVKYVECYVPCYSEQLKEILMDEHGNIDINKLPDELRYAVCNRFPTEYTYSMIPLKIKGFLPQQSGSGIVLPEEITTISGVDFDGDKMYMMLPEFNIIRYDYKKALKDFEESQKILGKIGKIFYNSDTVDNIVNTPVEFQEWFNENKDKYKLEVPQIRKVKYNFSKSAKDNSRRARNNLFIDMVFGVLTNKDTASKLLTPGGFDYQKRASRISDILANETIDSLSKKLNVPKSKFLPKLYNMSIKELESILESSINIDPIAPSTQLYFHKQNMTGKSLISIYAVHNASHATLQHTSLSISDDSAFTFNGKKLTSLHEIQNDSKEFISKNIAGFVSASVDVVKDPTLAGMNQDMFTAAPTMLLIRLGYNPIDISILMNQPIIKEITREVASNTDYNRSTKDIVEHIIKRYINSSEYNNELIYNLYKSNKFLVEDLATNILNRNSLNLMSKNQINEYYANQAMVGILFKNILVCSNALTSLVKITREDAFQGSSIADVEVFLNEVVKYVSGITGDNSVLNNSNFIKYDITGNTDELRDKLLNSSLPMLQAFFSLGIQQPNEMLSKYFPFSSPSFRDVLYGGMNNLGLIDYTRYNSLNSRQLNSIYNELVSYILTSTKFFGGEYVYNKEKNIDSFIPSDQKRNEFINYFTGEFNKIVSKNPDIAKLEFIQRLKVKKAGGTFPVDTLIFDFKGKLDTTTKDKYIRDWETLLYMQNPVANNLAINLFRYSLYRNGFAFSPNSFSSLCPTSVRLNTPEYVETLYKILKSENNYSNFIEQYIYNHLDDKNFVPEVSKKDSRIFKIDSGFKDEITVDVQSYILRNIDSLVKEFDNDTEMAIFYPFIAVRDNDKVAYYRSDKGLNYDSTVTYSRIIPLGSKSNFKEYQFGTEAIEMESVIRKNRESIISINESEKVYHNNAPISENTNSGSNLNSSLNQTFRTEYGTNFNEDEIKDNDILSLPRNTDYKDEEGNTICGG